jgi:hypothetical protein
VSHVIWRRNNNKNESVFLNGDFGVTWKEPVVACFKVLSQRENILRLDVLGAKISIIEKGRFDHYSELFGTNVKRAGIKNCHILFM